MLFRHCGRLVWTGLYTNLVRHCAVLCFQSARRRVGPQVETIDDRRGFGEQLVQITGPDRDGVTSVQLMINRVELYPTTRRRLWRLGYIGGSVGHSPWIFPPNPNHKPNPNSNLTNRQFPWKISPQTFPLPGSVRVNRVRVGSVSRVLGLR